MILIISLIIINIISVVAFYYIGILFDDERKRKKALRNARHIAAQKLPTYTYVCGEAVEEWF